MVIFTIGAIVAGLGIVADKLGQLASFINALPSTAKYILFLGILTLDAVTFKGAIGNLFSDILRYGFGFPVTITSWQLLIVFIMLPIIFYCLKN